MTKTIIAAVLIVALTVAGCSPVPWADCATEAEATYFEQQSDFFAGIRDALNEMDDLNSKLGADQTLRRDREWVADARAVHADAEVLEQQVKDMNVPASVEEIHEDVLEVAVRSKTAIYLYIEGITLNNQNFLNQSLMLLGDATTITERVKVRTDNFCQ